MNLIDRSGIDALFRELLSRGYTLVGPTVRDHAIVYEELSSPDELPAGYTDEQDGGTYRLTRGKSHAVFSAVVGPQSFKKFFFPPRRQLLEVTREGQALHADAHETQVPKLALFGARPCDLAALACLDRVLLRGPFIDTDYRRRRGETFVVAANCAHPAGTCFCASMGTGPQATAGFDLALTELVDRKRHDFLVSAATPAGEEVLKALRARPADEADMKRGAELLAEAAGKMHRALETKGIKELYYRNFENHRWEEIAERCLNCGNCTMVCPTCFCSTVEEVTDLTGDHAERWRAWDSCFTLDFSYIAGGNVRPSARGRYRQWMTHKLATWHDQFGSSGCVGCGRCITWCPVGIDITEEAAAIRRADAAARAPAR